MVGLGRGYREEPLETWFSLLLNTLWLLVEEVGSLADGRAKTPEFRGSLLLPVAEMLPPISPLTRRGSEDTGMLLPSRLRGRYTAESRSCVRGTADRRLGLAATSMYAPWEGRWACVGVMGMDAVEWSDGGVYMRLGPERERLDPTVDTDVTDMVDKVGIMLSGSPLICDLTSSDAKLRTSTAASFSARPWIASRRDRNCLSLGLLK